MNVLVLAAPSKEDADAIREYAAEFPADRMRVTLEEGRIPGLDHLEAYESVEAWLDYTAEMAGKIDWYMSVRKRDKRIVGFICLRHSLKYDDDDPEFCSHIGYSIRPSERGRGYAKEQLRLCLDKARALGLSRVRIVCRDINVGSAKTIQAVGGVYVDTLYGEESKMNILRFDVPTA